MPSIRRRIAATVLAGAILLGQAHAIAAPETDPLVLATAYPPTEGAGDRIYVEEGFEADLTRDLGEALGRSARLRPVRGDGPGGGSDGVFVRLPPDDPRLATGEAVALGYRSGLGVVMRSDTVIRRWEDLAGARVCVSEANRAGRDAAERYGAVPVVVRAPAPALMRVRTGDCVAAIHDQAVLEPLLRQRAWAKFSGTLAPLETTVLALLPARTEAGARLRKAAASLADARAWAERRATWASTVAFEVYRDQVGGDCH